MSWKDNLRPASFRGVPFKVQDHSAEIAGREIQLHEYPGRDVPYPEDMRRKSKSFTVEAYVLGADYMSARDRLIVACDGKGPGTLIHPYLGSLSVVCTGCLLRERADEGGVGRFQLTFAEGGTNQFPTSSADQSFAINQAADAAHLATREGFANEFSVGNAYMEAILGLPAMVEWYRDALAEEWVVTEDELPEV